MTEVYCTEDLERAQFAERPNRFIVFADHGGVRRRTYVANPGKLQEILLAGTTELLLAHKPHTKTKWECVAATWEQRWDGDKPRTVFLNTGQVNDVAEAYLREGLVPGLEQAKVIKREHTVGDSRFDFLMDTPEGELLLEVKSVTLVEEGMALFPDARSKRATRHVEELTELAEQGHPTAVLFMVQGDAAAFLPDLHNDLAFAQALRRAADHVQIFAIAVAPRLEGSRLCFPDRPTALPIPFDRLDPILGDGGLYLAVLEIEAPTQATIGALGTFDFEPGFYIYTGSAKKGLTKRMARHTRKRKRVHWHIDYLRNLSSGARTFAIRGARDESGLADDVARLGRRFPINFGATDCDDDGHLVFVASDPVGTPEFQRLLTRWRHQRVFATSEADAGLV